MKSQAANYLEVCKMLAGWTLKERLRFVAEELSNLADMKLDPGSIEGYAFEEILFGNIKDAIRMCDGDYEPPDPPGWEGGFADNH